MNRSVILIYGSHLTRSYYASIDYFRYNFSPFSPLETISTSLWASLYHHLPVLFSVMSAVSSYLVMSSRLSVHLSLGRPLLLFPGTSVLARNEEFSKIAVIKFFFTVLKKKNSYLWGGILRGKFRDIPRKSTV